MQKLPDVKLRVAQERDYELLEKWVARPEIFAFLDFDEPPNRHEIKVVVLARLVDILLIELDGKPVGFFLVYTKGMKSTNSREFDLAIAEKSARGAGVARAAIREFEDWAFTGQKLSKVHANIFPDNRASIALVHACGWPLSEVVHGGITFRGEPADVVFTWMTPELLDETRKKRGF